MFLIIEMAEKKREELLASCAVVQVIEGKELSKAMAVGMERENWNFKWLVGHMDSLWWSVDCSGEREREDSRKTTTLTMNLIT